MKPTIAMNKSQLTDPMLSQNIQERYNLAIDVGDFAIWEWNMPEDKIENYNENWKLLYEMNPEGITDQFNQRIFEDDKQSTWGAITEHLEGKTKSYHQVFRLVDSKGKIKWIRNSGRVIDKDANGNPIRVLGISADFTEQKETQINIDRITYELNKAQSLAKMGSWYLDIATNEVTWTEGIYRMYGFDPKLPPPPYTEHMKLFTDKSWQTLSKSLENTSKTGEPYDLELEMASEHSSFGWMRAMGEVVKDEIGKTIGLRGMAQDISEEKKRKEELIKARNQAIAANEQKDLFLANMTHEIRTPMNAVVGFSGLLKKETLSQKKKNEYIQQIQENSNQLLTLIDDILNLSLIQSNQFNLKKEPFDLCELLESIQQNLQLTLKKQKKDKHLKIVLKKVKTKKQLLGDKGRVTQILNNLLTNAIKYSLQGTIEIGTIEEKDVLKIYVKDQGIGIKEEDQQRIFDAFAQVSNSSHEGNSGIGLGLAICNSLAQAMSGYLELESTYQNGSIFYLCLPASLFSSAAEEEREYPNPTTNNQKVSIRDRKILIADDNESVRYFYKEILAEYEPQIYYAKNGAEAVAIIKDHEDLDIVLMDLKMPVMDGVEALKLSKSLRPELPVVAQSAFAMEDQIELYKGEGFDDYQTKPIEAEKIIELIHKLSAKKPLAKA
jgi:two-component system CheB/CheR fusion protein